MLVSVLMVTYNHDKFIGQAIEGVLMQETDFEYELVIANDCSPDNTDAIIKHYQNNHPNGKRINYINRTVNVGMHENYVDAYNKCSGKYIALCDGDDYFIDQRKLQMEVDILENDNNCSMVYTDSTDLYDEERFVPTPADDPDLVDFKYLLKRGWFIRTATIVYRKDCVDINPWRDVKYSMDFLMHYLAASRGYIKKLNKITSVYRHHSGGVTKVNIDFQLKRRNWYNGLLKRLDKFTEFTYTKDIDRAIKVNNTEIASLAIINLNFKYISYIFKSDIGLLFKTFTGKIFNRIGKIFGK